MLRLPFTYKFLHWTTKTRLALLLAEHLTQGWSFAKIKYFKRSSSKLLQEFDVLKMQLEWNIHIFFVSSRKNKAKERTFGTQRKEKGKGSFRKPAKNISMMPGPILVLTLCVCLHTRHENQHSNTSLSWSMYAWIQNCFLNMCIMCKLSFKEQTNLTNMLHEVASKLPCLTYVTIPVAYGQIRGNRKWKRHGDMPL